MDQSQPIQQQEEPIAAGGGRRARDRFSTLLYLRQLFQHEEKQSSGSRSVDGGRTDLPNQSPSSSLVLPKQPSLRNVPNQTAASSTRSNINSTSFNSASSSFGSAKSKAKASAPVSAPVGGSVGSSFASARSKASSSQVNEPAGKSNDDSASSFDFDASQHSSSSSIRSSWVEREGARRKQKGPNPFAFF